MEFGLIEELSPLCPENMPAENWRVYRHQIERVPVTSKDKMMCDSC